MESNAHALALPRSWLARLFIAATPPLFWLSALLFSRHSPGSFIATTEEDGPIENLEALVLLVAMVTSGWCAAILFRRNRGGPAALYSLLALLLLFALGEEISWGQRIFGVATPDWLQATNKQHELNVHNLKRVARFVSFAGLLIPLSVVGIATFSREIATRMPPRLLPFLWLPHPLFVPPWLCYLSYRAIRVYVVVRHFGLKPIGPVVSRLQEPAELIAYFAICAFLVCVLQRLRAQATRD